MSHAKTLTTIPAFLIFILVLAAGPAVAQTPTVLYSFSGTTDGSFPGGYLTLSGSTLYGMTSLGGSKNEGTIFSVSISSGTSTLLNLYSFTGSTDGANPNGSLVLSGSTLYGMTSSAGVNTYGTVFRIPITGGSPTILCAFTGSNGANPNGSLALSGSILYGMATFGGVGFTGSPDTGFGTIFRVSTSGGAPAILYSFSGGADGACPYGSLALSGSTLYGMTVSGGLSGSGTIFSIPTTGGLPTTLYSFTGSDGAAPYGDLTISGSTLYGMTSGGGTQSYGTIFSLTVSSGSGTLTTLCSFSGSGGPCPGGMPYGDLILSGSTLYGMTSEISTNGSGTIFCLPITGGTPRVMVSFNGSNGLFPEGSLTLSGTTLYGMTTAGGANSAGEIFSLPASTTLQCTLVVSPSSGGCTATVTPLQAAYSPGTVLTITASAIPGYTFVNWLATAGAVVTSTTSSATTLTVLNNFTLTASFYQYQYSLTTKTIITEAGWISVSPVQSTYLYGDVMTISQTANQYYQFVSWSVTGGTISGSTLTVLGNVTLAASYTWTSPLTTLWSFTSSNGAYPCGSLILGDSTLYGMTQYGGSGYVNGNYNTGSGTIFSVPVTGGAPTILFNFDGVRGYGPRGDLTFDGSTLYGMTMLGGASNDGTIFSIPAGGGDPTVLFSFDGTHGKNPYGNLTLIGSTLYGMTSLGGSKSNYGTIFSISTSGGTPNILFNFDYTHGSLPEGSLTLSGTTFYGMTYYGGGVGYGTVFSIPTIGGTPTVLYSFSGTTTDGAYPRGSLIISGSTLYGMTYQGGANHEGTIFSLPTRGGKPTILYSFDNTNGEYPYGSLTLIGTTLYGMSPLSGTQSTGTIFSVPTGGGVPTQVFDFYGTHGANPYGSLMLSDSTFYGLTSLGGKGNGTVFSIPVPPTPQYLVTVNQQTGGTVTVSPSLDVYNYTDTATITAAVSPGYSFVKWVVVGETVSSYTSTRTLLTVRGDVTLTPSFNEIVYSDTLTNVGGKILFTPSTQPYYLGTVLGLTASSIAGWQFVSWSATGASLTDSTSPTVSLTVLGNFSLKANFKAIISSVSGIAVPAEDGTVSVGSATGTLGQVISISQTTNPGFRLVSWTLSDGGNGAKFNSGSATITLGSSNVTVTASYRIAYSDTVTSVGSGTVRLTPSYTPYFPNTVVGVTASASTGWQFVSWSTTGVSVLKPTSSSTSLTVIGNFSLKANFKAIIYSVSGVASPAADGSVSVSSTTGTIGQVISISKTTNPTYSFVGWSLSDSGHGAKFNSGSSSITLGSSNVKITASFALINYPLTVHQSSSGVVTLSPSLATYTYSQTGTLTATPTASYNFVSWSVTGGSVALNTSSKTVLTVTTTCSVTASYHKIVFSDTLVDVGSGTIRMTPSNGPFYLGTVVGLTASASPGWKFVSWSTTGAAIISASSATTSLTVLGNFDVTAVFSAITYGVSGLAGPPAAGTVSVSSVTGTIGQVISLSQTATTGCSFANWLVNDGGHGAKLNSGSASITLGSSNVTVTASYMVSRFPVTVRQSTGGTVTLSPSQATYAFSQSGTLTATANTGSNFVSWSVTGGSVVSTTSSKTALTVTSSCTVTVSYAQTPYTVTATPQTGGAVTVTPSQAKYYYSNTASITALANPGYSFVSWSVTGGTVASITSSHTLLTVKGNVTLSASYHEIVYTDKLTDLRGTIQITPSHGPYYYGSVAGITATPSTGWQFVSWSFTGAALTDSTAATTSLTVLGNFDLTANFIAITYGVSGVASPTAGGTVSVGSATGTIGRVISITQTTNSGYHFTGWTLNDGGHGAKLNSGSASITLGSSNVTVTAVYSPVYSDTATDVGSGTIRLTPSNGPFYFGTVVGLTASANTGWKFVSWSTTGATVLSASSATTSLTVQGNFDVTAVFTAITYGVSGVASPAAAGTVSVGSATGTIGQVVSLSQTTNTGYSFIKWTVSDGGHGAKLNSDSASITFGSSNVTVTASYGLSHYPVTVYQSADGVVTLSPSLATYTYSQTGTLTATATASNHFVGWSVTGGSVESNTSSKTVLTVTGTCKVTASYNAPVYSKTLTDVGNGSIILSSSGPYSYGQVITATASDQTGYAFDGWSVTGPSLLDNSAAASTALTVYGNFTLTAYYSSTDSLTSLCSFTGIGGTAPGEYPRGSLVLSGSTLYGLTGAANYNGTIFSLPTRGGNPTILYTFSGSTDGAVPYGSLILNGSTLYGVTSQGGNLSLNGGAGDGTIFSIPTSGGKPTTLYKFDGTPHGADPEGSLTLSGTTLFGMTSAGGAYGYGTVFSIPIGGGTPSILYTFSGTTDGAYPLGSLTLSGSMLYGLAQAGGADYNGTIFRLPASGGKATVLYTFSGTTDGEMPSGDLTISGSTLYGMTLQGGALNDGTIFSIPTTGGSPTILYTFSGGATDGANPRGSLTLSGSTLYGMASSGGPNNAGVIFRLPAGGGKPTILCSFTGIGGAATGKAPNGNLTLYDSTLYGMTLEGGNSSLELGAGQGTVFRFPITSP